MTRLRIAGAGEFCSETHKQKYQEEYNRLALGRLLGNDQRENVRVRQVAAGSGSAPSEVADAARAGAGIREADRRVPAAQAARLPAAPAMASLVVLPLPQTAGKGPKVRVRVTQLTGSHCGGVMMSAMTVVAKREPSRSLPLAPLAGLDGTRRTDARAVPRGALQMADVSTSVQTPGPAGSASIPEMPAVQEIGIGIETGNGRQWPDLFRYGAIDFPLPDAGIDFEAPQIHLRLLDHFILGATGDADPPPEPAAPQATGMPQPKTVPPEPGPNRLGGIQAIAPAAGPRLPKVEARIEALVRPVPASAPPASASPVSSPAPARTRRLEAVRAPVSPVQPPDPQRPALEPAKKTDAAAARTAPPVSAAKAAPAPATATAVDAVAPARVTANPDAVPAVDLRQPATITKPAAPAETARPVDDRPVVAAPVPKRTEIEAPLFGGLSGAREPIEETPESREEGLPHLQVEAARSSGFKIALVLGALLAIGAVIYFVAGGKSEPAASAEATESTPMAVGGGGWSPTDSAMDESDARTTRQISFYRPSLQLSDYRVEFSGTIEKRALGWVFRMSDMKNYYGMKIWVAGGRAALIRYVVIEGRESGRMEIPLAVPVRLGSTVTVKFDAKGPRFNTVIQGQPADVWTNSQLKVGAFGFANDRDERAKIGNVQLGLLRGGSR